MKVIDLLNKIANGEIDEDIKIEFEYGYNYEYCTIREFFDRYILDKENLNQEIIIEDTPKENKKIEKLDNHIAIKRDEYCDFDTYWNDKDNVLVFKINEIIDKLNGDE